jgi:membrane-bound serine protease (ClpP class)
MHPPPPPRTIGRWHCRAATMLVAAAAMLALVPPTEAVAKQAVVLKIDGAIGPAIADNLVRELRAAKPGEIGLIVLRMNTPGGLDTSMRTMINAILASPVPVATYVAPNGARAASAGTYIAYASAIAAMALPRFSLAQSEGRTNRPDKRMAKIRKSRPSRPTPRRARRRGSR